MKTVIRDPQMPTAADITATFEATFRSTEPADAEALAVSLAHHRDVQVMIRSMNQFDGPAAGKLLDSALSYREALREVADPRLLAGRLKLNAAMMDEGADRAAELDEEFALKAEFMWNQNESEMAEQFEQRALACARLEARLINDARIARARARAIEARLEDAALLDDIAGVVR